MVKKRVHKSTQKWESYYNSLAKEAKCALRIGLLAVLFGSLALLSLVSRAESAAQVRLLKEAFGAVGACVPIVFGGAAALDCVIKER